MGGVRAQICDPTQAPTNLVSTLASGAGVLLQWDAVPGSVGIQLRADLPSGASIVRRIAGFERDFYLVPEAILNPGVYTWSVQAACSSIPPYNVTPVSALSSFTFGSGCPATIMDIDGNVYPTVEIGGQCWMKENLKVEHYRNGDAILTGLTDLEWNTTSEGAYSIYQNHAANKDIYGLLYNWFSVDDTRKLCPIGWHEPSDAEWNDLALTLGGRWTAGGRMKTTGDLTSGTGLWESPNTAATNISGFSGLPGGYRSDGGPYNDMGLSGYLWTSNDFSTETWFWVLTHNDDNAFHFRLNKGYGFSVRCLKD